MRKNAIVLSTLILTGIISTLMIHPSEATISMTKWLQPTFSGTDAFYGGPAVVAYKEGSTVKLAVSVTPAPYSWVNVTWVRISFGWGKTYNSTEADGVKPATEIDAERSVYVFNILFTAPSTAEASNLVKHSYTVSVSYNYSGGTDKWTSSGTDFVVYSDLQAEAQALNQQVDAYPTTWGFSSSEAQVLWEKAKNIAASGDTYYASGDFTNAKGSYQSALDLFDQAFAAEKTYQTAVDTAGNTALSNYYNALADNAATQANASRTEAEAAQTEANAAMKEADSAAKQAEAALTNAYGWVTFGVGWIFIGIGAIVYGLRKQKPPT